MSSGFESERLHVEVSETKCQTIGRCVEICPEMFHFSAFSKKATVRMPDIPPRLLEKVRKAAAACPSGAIKITG